MTSSPVNENGSITSNTVMINTSAPLQARDFNGADPDTAQAGAESFSTMASQKIKSGPSTPSHHFPTSATLPMSPSTSHPTREGSPRSQNSESSHTTPGPRRPVRGCRFEAGMARARRRVPYSLGPEKLREEPEEAQKKLGPHEESNLTADMQELYSQLVPPTESIERRTRFVQKLESILQARWPGQYINVSVFGSTGNCLGTSDSDVDVCITTDCNELSHVCSIADLLDKAGMERVVCVSSAKVPIVKVWDPELQVACDMNVNNPIALENTQMIRTYTAIDERFRPLAMIVKYWAKKRLLNDAALGGTLSSYTWICMVLNFLQTRDPPILPCLQQQSSLKPRLLNGINVAFDKNPDDYRAFGAQNKASLGHLLFDFFRYYGHELNYEGNALSVRLGKVIPKSQKAWHLLQDNRLCVEEPFNTSRNLANTADDTSMRGIHLELRRAFRLVTAGKLDVCCEQYEAGPEERKITETFIHPTARPIIPQAPAQPGAQSHRNGRNGFRGPRNNNRNSGRRASNPAGRNSTYLHDLPFQMTPQELQLQAQHQQHLLHDQLFQQYQFLQLQEQELRMQLYQQNLRQRGLNSGQSASPNGHVNSGNTDGPSAMTSNTAFRIAMSPTMFQNRYGTSPFLRNTTPVSGVMTNPASPLLGNAVPDARRYTRRTSIPNSSPAGSLRAQSQPARTMPFGGGFQHVRSSKDVNVDLSEVPADRRTSYSYYPHVAVPGFMSQPASVSGSLYEAGRRPAEYMGYYVGHSPALPANATSTTISPIPSHAGLAIHNGGLSPKYSSRSSRLPSVTSSPSLQSASLEDASEIAALSDVANDYHTASERLDSPKPRSGPLIVDGSVYSPQRRRPTVRPFVSRNDGGTLSASTSDDPGIDTPSSSDDQYQEHRKTSLAKRKSQATQLVKEATDQMKKTSIDEQPALASASQSSGQTAIDELKTVPGILNELGLTTTADDDESVLPNRGEAKANGTVNRKKKSRTEKPTVIETESSTEPSTPLGPRTNGQDVGEGPPLGSKHTDASTGWQTQKKKKRTKKTVRSENDASLINSAGGELLPVDETLRKGG